MCAILSFMEALDASPGDQQSNRITPVSGQMAQLGQWAIREVRNALGPMGLKRHHFAALQALRYGPLQQQRLGDVMGVYGTHLVGFLNELERENLVSRRRDPDDRRRHIVQLSTLGRARLAATDAVIAELDARLLEGLTLAQQAQFVALVDLVAHNRGFDAPVLRRHAKLKPKKITT